jgi:hypothetical protein
MNGCRVFSGIAYQVQQSTCSHPRICRLSWRSLPHTALWVLPMRRRRPLASFPIPARRENHPLRGFWQFMYHLDGVTLRAVLQNARQQRLFNRAAELAYLVLLTLGTGILSLAGAIATFPWLRGVFTPWVPAPAAPWPTGALLPTLVHTPCPPTCPCSGSGSCCLPSPPPLPWPPC